MEHNSKVISGFFSRVLFGLTTAVAITACSSAPTPTSTEQQSNLQIASGGLVSINRVAPAISSPSVLFGFMPDKEQKSSWLEINTSNKEVSLYEKGELVQKAKIEGNLDVEPGRYQIKHKQRSALWYAGDDYFLSRQLPVPEVGNRERYRRGALGDFALFLDTETPIHSSPIWTPEVGGLKLDDEQMRKIYYALEVGSVVEVR
jgi:hypothetical protein